MKEILYIASNMEHIRHFHTELIEKLAENGWQVDLACRDVTDEGNGVRERYNIPFSKHISLLKNLKAILQLREILKKRDYAVVFCHTSLAAFFTRLILLGKRKRPFVINMVHGYLFDENTPWIKQKVLTVAEAITAPVTDLVLTMNAWDTDYAQRRQTSKRVIRTKGLGIEFARFTKETQDKVELRKRLGLPKNACILICPAEFSARKNQSFLIERMEELPEEICLVLLGEGKLRALCWQEVEAKKLKGRIFFPGYQRDLNPWFRASDIAVSASRIEGLPASVLEAMYCGLPVVASRIKGHTDLVREGKTGFLCQGREQWIEKICRLAEDAALRKQMGAEGRAAASAYRRSDCAEEIRHIIEQVEDRMRT